MQYGLSDNDLLSIQSVLQHFPQVEQAILYGSRAKGNYKTGSDVDIALEWPRWYAANRALIGGSPDVLLPGQILQAPAAL